MALSRQEPILVTARAPQVDGDGNPVLDDYGNQQTTTTSITRDGLFAPAIGYEATEGQDQVVSQPQALFTGDNADDVAAVVSATSQLTIRGDVYQVDGDPSSWKGAGLVLPLKKVTG